MEASEPTVTDKPSPELILQKWLRRLEDPNRKQRFGFLRCTKPNGECDGMCAMGELADVLVSTGLANWSDNRIVINGKSTYASIPPSELGSFLGITLYEAKILQDGIITMNDSGATFPAIAQRIREKLNIQA